MLLVGLLLAGGASRADVLGQVVVRFVAWAVLLIGILFARHRPEIDARAPLVLCGLALLLVLVQLVPLPPSLWQGLPGRSGFVDAWVGGRDAWRPWSIVPGATVNAAGSLIVPFATLFLVPRLARTEQQRLLAIVLGLIAVSTLVAIVQFSGVVIDNPFVNDTIGERGGTFANRNHYALFAALGCMVAPAWAFAGGGRPGWRVPVAFGFVLLFALMILASGSRAGIVVGLLGLIGAVVLTGQDVKRALNRYPRWVFPALIAGIAGTIAVAVLASVAADRAVSIDRLFTSDPGQDMRTRGLPTVLMLLRTFFPIGLGSGGFETLFKIHEPSALLKPTYFNQAHDDFLDVALATGLPGVALLLAALGWWAWASVRAWRGGRGSDTLLPRLGSAMIGLVLLASAVDYPARTPLVMAVLMIAATWLAGQSKEGRAASFTPPTP